MDGAVSILTSSLLCEGADRASRVPMSRGAAILVGLSPTGFGFLPGRRTIDSSWIPSALAHIFCHAMSSFYSVSPLPRHRYV